MAEDPNLLRDRLANERTLLAWLRTALSFMAFGLVLAKFALFLAITTNELVVEARRSSSVGAFLVLVGGVLSLVGAQRTHAYAKTLAPSSRMPGNATLYVSALFVSALGVGLSIHLLRTSP